MNTVVTVRVRSADLLTADHVVHRTNELPYLTPKRDREVLTTRSGRTLLEIRRVGATLLS